MLGDDAYTAAFQSRFDLAGSALRSFEGSLFEEDGINLSGVAGYEMYTLYQAAQYYQLALDRFYGLVPYIWSALARPTGESFVTQQMITTYVARLLRASTQRANAWSEVAQRYQRFERPDLARRVVGRAYTSAYLESIVLSRLIKRIAEGFANAPDRPQLLAELDHASTTYEVALLDMRDLFDDLNGSLNYFGFPPDYIPLPALVPNGPNAFETLLDRAELSTQFAASREETAIAGTRSYEVDEAAFQGELVSIRNTYEDQLAQLCGTFALESGRVYPAIRRYAYLDDYARGLGDPCGLMGTGDIHAALAEIELARVEMNRVSTAAQHIREALDDEETRVAQQCDLITGFADFQVSQEEDANKIETLMRASQFAVNEMENALADVKQLSQYATCIPPIAGVAASPGNCAQAAVAATVYSAASATGAITRAHEFAVTEVLQGKLDDMRVELINEEAGLQCEQLNVDSLPRINDLLRQLEANRLDAIRAEYQARLAMATVSQLRNQAHRIEGQWQEADRMSIDLQAAKNDPNVRIYKNDAVINAEVAFEAALRDAYRATRVFEYYTSQSYARRAELYLVRLVGHGDHNLQNYLADLREAYYVFLEQYGRPDRRVDVVSLRDDILRIPRMKGDSTPYKLAERLELFRSELTDSKWIDPQGQIAIAFSTTDERLSPLTRNHKIEYIEAEITAANFGDAVGRVYLRATGTSKLKSLGDLDNFYRFPERLAVINTMFNGERKFVPEVYRNDRLRDRPYINSDWELVISTNGEYANRDIDLDYVTDVVLYIHYSDFTAF